MISFFLKNDTVIIPTSAHGCKFSDDTIFVPTDAQVAQIKKDWGCLQILRIPTEAYKINGMSVMRMSQEIPVQGLNKLREVEEVMPEDRFIVLVPYMVVAALHEMGVRDEFRFVLATNATKETSREQPQNKIWDINSWAY